MLIIRSTSSRAGTGRGHPDPRSAPVGGTPPAGLG
ncbi:hypothetical protein Ae168Ps1_2057 [Pseudonocardia sp. Ae168_Ps1]|nr:hypothetical protein Ae168Ps1_2057 [Pseudonocardia sp. Ae168_Ps1]